MTGSMPIGRSAFSSSIVCWMFSPSASTSPPSRIEIDSPSPGVPLIRNIGSGGSAYSRRTSAMSANRTFRPPTSKFICENVLFRRHGAADPQRYALLVGGDDAGRSDRVLRLQRSRKLRRLETVAGELGGRELDEDAFGLLADEVHLVDIGHLQQPRPDILHVVAQLAMGEPVRRESIDDAVCIPEFVIGDRADDALRQGQFDVFDLLADLVPGVRHRLRPGRSLEIDKDRRLTWVGVALDVVEVRRLLQLALDALGDLQQRVVELSRPATVSSPSSP